MSFQIRFTDFDRETNAFSISLIIGEVSVKSLRQGVEDHFRDLLANKKYLSEKVLSKIFFGDSPVANVEIGSGDIAHSYIFKRDGADDKKISGEFSLSHALCYLQGVLDALEVPLRQLNFNMETLLEQVDRDMSDGVYGVFLRK